jgi:hypothetical protein
MLNQTQINEIREHLDKAQNPLFFFDNDVDGLVSFLIFQRYLERGRGIPIKSFPALSQTYVKRIKELKPDYIFVLDKNSIEPEFIKEVDEMNIPLVVIDHHNVPKIEIENYYNPFYVDGKTEPVSYLAYKIAQKKSDLWLAVIGCISDGFIPEFFDEFKKGYIDLLEIKIEEDRVYDSRLAFDILYNTQIGKIIQILNYGLLDRTTNVVKMLRYLMKAKTPHDIIHEGSKTKTFLARFAEISARVKTIVEKAEDKLAENNESKLLVFTYGGDMSLSQHVSNELAYRHPDKVLAVGYKNGNYVNFSLRGPLNVRDLTLSAIEGIPGAQGGGHEHATGAKITADQLDEFKRKLEEGVGKE